MATVNVTPDATTVQTVDKTAQKPRFSASDFIRSGLSAVGGGLLSGALQLGFNHLQNKQNQKMWYAQQRYLENQQARMQRQAPSNQAEGYKDAGFSPVLMTGGVQTPSVGTAPAGSAQQFDPKLLDWMLGQTQAELQMSTARVQNAEAEGQEIQNNRSKAEDEAAATNMIDWYERQLNSSDYTDKEKQFFRDQLKILRLDGTNVGGFNGLKAYNHFIMEMDNIDTYKLANTVQRLIYSEQFKSNKYAAAVANRPVWEIAQIINAIECNSRNAMANMQNARANTLNAQTNADVNYQNAETNRLNYELSEANNLPKLMSEGEYGMAFWNLLDKALDTGAAFLGKGSRHKPMPTAVKKPK